MKLIHHLFCIVAASLLMFGMPQVAKGEVLSKTTVAQGLIEGLAREGYALYPAIPYAEAPVGNLRWKAPVPKKAWDGVYRTQEFMPQPPQPSDRPCSEDCLYLSVQTPAQSTSDRLPVFVNIHGGGFSGGHYAGTLDGFVRNGIVYVSIEYRLGVLGFMAHPELAKESSDGLSGNYGILDQICALQWIHNNITAFGGDSQNVTIMGESAGGISVSILCASPMCKGLFQRAISESGGSFWPKTDKAGSKIMMCTAKAAEELGLAFQKKMGAKNLKQLRKLPFEKLVADQQMQDFWPVIDGRAIIDDQYKLYEAGQYNDVDVLMGTNSDEGWMFSNDMPVDNYVKYLQAEFGDFADRAITLYPATSPQEARCAFADIFRDVAFAWPTYTWANLQTKSSKKNIFVYFFDQNSAAFGKTPRGANHVSEMPFVYGWGHERMTTTEHHMAQIMSQYWMNFAKTGNPNADGLPYWTPYRQGEPTVMYIHEGFHLTKMQNQAQLDFFEAFYKTKR